MAKQVSLKKNSAKSQGVLFKDIGHLLTLSPAAKKEGRKIQEADLGLTKRAAILVNNGNIVWVGAEKDLPKGLGKEVAREVSLGGATVLPAFVECHTHLVFAGSRSNEFEMRVRGASYQEIAEKGGGIKATVEPTRKASVASLAETAQARANQFVVQGVTTIECKSGYGLTLKDEMKILEAAGQIKGARIVRTYLGPHAIPAGRSAEDYMKEIITRHLPELKKRGLACRVDIFVEKGYFEEAIARKYLDTAKSLGFDLAVHADQLTRAGGAKLAIEFGARSAEHLIQINDADVRALAKSQVTSVLLPAADLYLKCDYPPARSLIDSGARVALATDFNPGTSPTQSLSLVGVLARLEMKMSLAEVLAAYTVGAAHALGLQDSLGSLQEKKRADFAAFDADWTELFYSVGPMRTKSVWREGKPLWNEKGFAFSK